jgi:hypothetical protein
MKSLDQVIAKLPAARRSVSRLESRSDLLLSTLRGYVEAMGGSLKLVVEFPDSTAVLASLGEVSGKPKSRLGATQRKVRASG